MLARVPGIFTWDDHDIFDGWGSHAAKDLDSPYFRAVYEAAEKAFVAFQLGGGRHVVPQEGSGRRHFLQHLHFATGDRELDLVLLDLRSARRPDEVLGRAQWADLKRLLARINATPAPTGGRHVLVVSSVPVLYLGFGGVERALEKLPLRTYLEDDLRDQWESPAHRGERAALVMNLLECAEKDRVRVTLLSGDVHVAARGRITATRKGAAIEQLISSPIAHPPVPRPAWALMSMVAERGPFEIAEGVQGELQPISSKGLFLRERNWLSIRFDEAGHNEGRLWAKWFAEESGGISQEAVRPAL